MANIFTSLPAPAANAAGAWVDVSAFGALKTITVEGNGTRVSPFVLIEYSNELVPTHAVPLVQFSRGEATREVACHWMRVVVKNYTGGGAPTVEVGGTDDGAQFDQLPVASGNGPAAGVDVSALGLFKTVQVGGSFRGSLQIEISEDGGSTYSQILSFQQPGAQSAIFAADFARVSRNGVPQVAPGLPDVWIAGTAPIGGSIGVFVQDEGVDIGGNPHKTLDFIGAGVTATDAGGGVADITIPGDAGPGARQSFPYIATGAENPNGFDINLPAARPNLNYLAIVTCGPMAVSGTVLAFAVQAQTLSKITVVPSAQPTANDHYWVEVEQFT